MHADLAPVDMIRLAALLARLEAAGAGGGCAVPGCVHRHGPAGAGHRPAPAALAA